MRRLLGILPTALLLTACPKAVQSTSMSSPPPEPSMRSVVSVVPMARTAPIAFARLVQHEGDASEQDRWDWPGDARFEEDWTAGGFAHPMVRGQISTLRLDGKPDEPGGVEHYRDQIAAAERGEAGALLFDPQGVHALAAFAPQKTVRTASQILESRRADGWVDGRFVVIANVSEEVEPPDPESEDPTRRWMGRWEKFVWALVFDGPPPQPTSAGGLAWVEASYTTTLLDGPHPSRRVRPNTPEEQQEAALAFDEALDTEDVELLHALLSQPLDSTDGRWKSASELARSLGELDLAVQLRGPYLPRAMCSMDRSPQREGLGFAQLCAEAGDTSCFLQLMVTVMGNNFGTFMVRSSYGDAAAPTHAERLAEIGIDTEQFLLGLLFVFEGTVDRNVALGPRRLGRAMAATEDADRFEMLLVAHARDGELDDYNRLRATWALGSLMQHRDGDKAASAALVGYADAGGFVPEAERWIRGDVSP